MLAAVLPVQVACTNCNGVGYFEVPCPKCQGSGVTVRKVKKSVVRSVGFKNGSMLMDEEIACRDCSGAIYKIKGKGSGKKKITCKVCHGNKKIRK